MKKALKIVLFVVLSLIIIGMLASRGEKQAAGPEGEINQAQPVQAQPQPAQPSEPKKPDLELLEAKSETGEFGARYVVGKVRNNSNKTYTYVQVEINLYDAQDNQVGSTLANTNNLEPGATWSFKAVILEDKATKFKVMKISGW